MRQPLTRPLPAAQRPAGLSITIRRGPAANDVRALPRTARDPALRLRCVALAHLVLREVAALGLLLSASRVAVELLEAGGAGAAGLAQTATFPAPEDPRATLAAQCVARLAVEAEGGGCDPAYLLRCVAAVLGQLGARDVAERVERAWQVDAS